MWDQELRGRLQMAAATGRHETDNLIRTELSLALEGHLYELMTHLDESSFQRACSFIDKAMASLRSNKTSEKRWSNASKDWTFARCKASNEDDEASCFVCFEERPV